MSNHSHRVSLLKNPEFTEQATKILSHMRGANQNTVSDCPHVDSPLSYASGFVSMAVARDLLEDIRGGGLSADIFSSLVISMFTAGYMYASNGHELDSDHRAQKLIPKDFATDQEEAATSTAGWREQTRGEYYGQDVDDGMPAEVKQAIEILKKASGVKVMTVTGDDLMSMMTGEDHPPGTGNYL